MAVADPWLPKTQSEPTLNAFVCRGTPTQKNEKFSDNYGLGEGFRDMLRFHA